MTLDFKLFIDSIHILFLLYLLLWFSNFNIKNLQDFIKTYRALIKDIFLLPSRLPSSTSPVLWRQSRVHGLRWFGRPSQQVIVSRRVQ